GYAKVDADFAKKVIILTDDLVSYPNYPASIDQTKVDMVVLVDKVGDQDGIARGATRFSKNPKELLIAQNAAEFIANSKYFYNGFSFQTGSGGSSLAVTRFLKKYMEKNYIKASFILGGITKPIVDLYNDGLVGKLFDVQTFDISSCQSIVENKDHFEIDASMYANPHNMGAFVNKLDVVILSALEIDKNFNVNVITGSNGIIRGASGGHSDTSAGAKLTVIVAPLVRGRIPTIVEKVITKVTPGSTVDVLITERGIAINPLREDLISEFKDSKLPIITMDKMLEKVKKIIGTPNEIEFEDEVVAIVEYRDGTVIDTIKKIK
ncbi:MAG: citrate lyase subunit alpha, partial [Acidaminobacteraceae bacterium]